MRNIKTQTIAAKILALFSALAVSFFILLSAPLALADPHGCAVGTTFQNGQCVSDSSTGSKTIDPCAGVTSTGSPTCTQCHPTDSNGNSLPAPSLCVCHPEYNYGAALSPNELTSCKNCNGSGSTTATCLQHNQVVTRLNQIINIIAGIASLVIVGMLIFAGIRYSMAGSPQQSAEAKKHIINVVIALAVLVFMWGFLQWIIPGGI